ncbi:hypothetical protein Btru_051636 [Bulinus truncatus]|nr:hypothetical protein Btru_051636 [Bulinus truncatus]
MYGYIKIDDTKIVYLHCFCYMFSINRNNMSNRQTLLNVKNKIFDDDHPNRTSPGYGYDAYRHHTSHDKRHLKLALALVLTSIITCVMVLTIAVFSMIQQSYKPSSAVSSKAIACVDCNQLITKSSNGLIDLLTHEIHDGTSKCCAYNSHQLSALFGISMRREEIHRVSLSILNVSDFSLTPVSAHKILYPPKYSCEQISFQYRKPTFVKGTVHVLFQYEDRRPDPLREHARNIGVLKDGLKIQHSGSYYMYSSIHYMPESHYPCKDFKYQTWIHYVEKKPVNQDKSIGLMKTYHTCCDSCAFDEETSYNGGVFNLEAGDVIHISIDGYCLVNFHDSSSFAGLIYLGPGDGRRHPKE